MQVRPEQGARRGMPPAVHQSLHRRSAQPCMLNWQRNTG
jgi:hypothetical protein